ncbi:MAG TPA: hypothetical protein VJ732_16090 [Bryobacteraceae bacterium]|nr:hypothetical protein [Bryobacteraceae bacterium]
MVPAITAIATIPNTNIAGTSILIDSARRVPLLKNPTDSAAQLSCHKL